MAMAGAGRDSSAAHRDSELELGLVIVDLLESPQKLGEERSEEVLRLCVRPLGELQQGARRAKPSQCQAVVFKNSVLDNSVVSL